ncbi:putative Fe-containing alcohol dehydrogenase [Polychaeton citri CBS 116435]|uniref:Fe-containing alcohol dehydrogenase n=1 Tax=Polychaeton citri CBS 116435 TaxID=1314669 RepID=A0A9P4QC05_9PEZI|nr:putative Fe-containing alcohol dehydrogenase [Polychaeton citri CBS 116435]
MSGFTLRPAFPDLDHEQRPYTLVSDGLPYDEACRVHLDGFINARRAYIIVSKSLAAQTDRLQRLERTLGPRHVGSWLGIPAHTPYEALIDIINDMRAKQADCLITVGGGSLADGAQIIAYALANDVHTLNDLTQLGNPFRLQMNEIMTSVGKPNELVIGKAPEIPLIFMPTTLSGAEYSRYGAGTEPVNKLKIMFTHPRFFASLIILDPELASTTPDWVWRSTGVRAIDHCVENIASSNSKPESDKACERGLVRLVRSLLVYAKNPNDLSARLESMMGCNDSMTGLNIGVMAGASHGIGHQLGPLGVGHGQTSCILSPAVEKYNARVNKPQQDKIHRILWDQPDIAAVLTQNGLQRHASDVGDALRAIFNELGMPKTLQEVGVGRDKWEQIAENSLEDHLARMNPIPITRKEQVYEILQMVEGDVAAVQ